MSKQKIQLLIFILILLCGCIFGYYKLVFFKQMSGIKKADAELKKNQLVLDKLREIKQDKKGALNKISDMERQLGVFDIAIPDNNNSYEFNMELYHTLKARGLTINSLNPLTPGTGNGYSYQTININISGKKQNVLNFIKYLQDNPREITIKEFNIRESNAEEINANLKANIYFINK